MRDCDIHDEFDVAKIGCHGVKQQWQTQKG